MLRFETHLQIVTFLFLNCHEYCHVCWMRLIKFSGECITLAIISIKAIWFWIFQHGNICMDINNGGIAYSFAFNVMFRLCKQIMLRLSKWNLSHVFMRKINWQPRAKAKFGLAFNRCESGFSTCSLLSLSLFLIIEHNTSKSKVDLATSSNVLLTTVIVVY